jgi:tRNA(Ile)-lysidine synthase
LRLPPLIHAVARALRAAEAPFRGETLVVGLSGGADSVALLDALAVLQGPFGFRLVAAHLDHGLRPSSTDDAAFCALLCERLGVPLRREAAARRERYGFLRRVGREERAAAIAVAHTRDDQAETLLLRLLRGAGATGLSAMRARRGRLLRPLLAVSREQVLAHLRDRSLEWREDPSNADPAHLRNRVRHELLPYLESRFNPRARAVIARAAALLGDEAAHLRREARALLGSSARQEPGALAVRRPALAGAPLAVARAAVLEALRRSGGLRGVRAVHVDRVVQAARRSETSGPGISLPGGRAVRVTRDEVRVERRSPSG